MAARGGHEEVCFCHNIPHNPHTICTDVNGLINGHTAHVGTGFDTLGECAEELATPSPSVEPEPSPTPEPTDYPEPTSIPAPSSTPDADVSPSPTELPVDFRNGQPEMATPTYIEGSGGCSLNTNMP